MTDHYFDHPLANIHYYRFGKGPKAMLCFHGYGMHGKQFKLLETTLGEEYTFYGFDLFFHKETKLKDPSLEKIKAGLSKKMLTELIESFCRHESVDRFSVIGYSMGTHFATTLAEEIPNRINEYIVLAPSCLNPGRTLWFFCKNKLGNRLLEKLTLSNSGLLKMLNLCKRLHIVDAKGYEILYKEIATPELRFNFYASATYFRFLEMNEQKLIKALNDQKIKSIFIFGKRDVMFPPKIGKRVIPRIQFSETLILDENHDMINRNLVAALTKILIK